MFPWEITLLPLQVSVGLTPTPAPETGRGRCCREASMWDLSLESNQRTAIYVTYLDWKDEEKEGSVTSLSTAEMRNQDSASLPCTISHGRFWSPAFWYHHLPQTLWTPRPGQCPQITSCLRSEQSVGMACQ